MVMNNMENVYAQYGGAAGHDRSIPQSQMETVGSQADYFMRQVYSESRNERTRRNESELDVYLREGREYSANPLQW